VWRSLRASWACGLTKTVDEVLTDWMITMVARTESSKVSRCFRWSVATPSKAVGRGGVGLWDPTCGFAGAEWSKGALLG
jgi:hypothetical protein